MELDFVVAKVISKFMLGEKFGVIDAGSHAGDFTRFLLDGKNYDRAIMIEPLPDKFELISREFINANIVNCALSNNETNSHMYVTVNFPKCSALYDRPAYDQVPDLNNRQKIDVKIRRLESVLDDLGFDSLNVDSWYFKVDTEGFEIETFLGLGKYRDSEKIAAGHFEYGGTWKERNLKLADMIKILDDSGFHVFKCEIQDQNLLFIDNFPQVDDYEYSNLYFIKRTIAKKYNLI